MSVTAITTMSTEEHTMPGTTMKAFIQERYCPPEQLELREVEIPAVGDDNVLVRVRAASVNPADWRPMRGKPFSMRLMVGLRRPKGRLIGGDVAGVVEAVGKDVTMFRPGDEVFGARSGAFAEYVLGRERNFVKKPVNISFEQAASIAIAGTTALQALRDWGQLQAGQRVLINGAAGGVGTFSVQIAKALGAHVTGVTSTRNVELVRSLGADRVIDYTREDFARSGERYDLVVDNVGNRALRHLRRVLTPNGTLVIVGAKHSRWMLGLMGQAIRARLLSRFVSQRLVGLRIAQLNPQDLTVLRELVEAGRVTPVVDRTYPLRQVPEAILYVEAGHAPAKVVITV